ncbi:MAG: archaellin/type IV pilin N-terminal domain-containing protein [Candidatus Methanospirareceae archaeon]
MDRSKSGISPVMATVILVAIAIVIAIAVAFWATGLVGVFTRFEKIEIVAAYAQAKSDGEGYEVVLVVKNTGSADATIDDIYVNGKPCGGISGETCSVSGDTDAVSPLSVGGSATLTVGKPPGSGASFVPGVTYEVAVHTASGKMYPAAVLIS